MFQTKKPKTAYILFCQDVFKNKNIYGVNGMHKASAMFKELPEEELAKYKSAADKQRTAYKITKQINNMQEQIQKHPTPLSMYIKHNFELGITSKCQDIGLKKNHLCVSCCLSNISTTVNVITKH